MAVRVHFQTEMESFRAGMVEMASVVLNQVERAVAAWETLDFDAADAVIAGDDRVDERCVELDQKIFSIQLLEAPVAADLRLLHVGLITVIALERVGDLAVAMATLARNQRPEATVPEVQELVQRMSSQAVDTLAVAVQAIARGDVELGERAVEQARHVKGMLNDVLELAGTVQADPQNRSWRAAAILTARHLERVANNGAELGGRVRFLVTGEPFVRKASA
ncbi:MAG: hypothetical protein IT200_02445 [Thermoleophilia bacterium]|nr:hypothetical protein [Thermoleophilia bacterium]